MKIDKDHPLADWVEIYLNGEIKGCVKYANEEEGYIVQCEYEVTDDNQTIFKLNEKSQ